MTTQKHLLDGEKETAYIEMISPNSDVGMIIVHGMGEHSGRYVEFMQNLFSCDYSAFALDLIGHGKSSGNRGDINQFIEYVAQIKHFVSFIRERFPSMKIGLFGHSLGGLVSCWHVSKMDDIRYLILSSPLLERRWYLSALQYIPYRIFGDLRITKRWSESKEMLKVSRDDPLSCKDFTIRSLKEVFVAGVNQIQGKLPSIETPLLLLGGMGDKLINAQGLSKIINRFGSNDRTLKLYERARHRLVQGECKNEVIEDIHTWVSARVKQ
jgi:alpha-beta hydrolase superfamily lysophospholipase